MWKSLYDSFLQSMTVQWAKFIQDNKSCGKAVRDNFQNKVYSEIGLYAIIITLILSVSFYYYFNLRFGRYYSLKSWIITLCLNSILVGIATYFLTKGILNNPICDASRQLLWISLINAIYAAIFFFLISLVIKWGSPMGKRTPF